MDTRVRGTGNLPRDTTSFVDRERDSDEVIRLLSVARLVTVTGVGGVGKTRLALHVADRLHRVFADGVWWVDLAQVRDGELVPHAIAQALGVQDETGRDPLVVLDDFLRNRKLLVVLDNCEHVVDACASVVYELLRGSEGLRVLATSREGLAVVGEHIWPVLPLPVPDASAVPPFEVREKQTHKQYAAVTLFLQRAAAAHTGFRVTDENRGQVEAICRRLDGLPLALELAAARLGSVSVGEVLEHLDDVPELWGRPAFAGHRHPSLTAAVDWSFQLCTDVERAAWTRASVFAGHFDIAAAEEVCAGDDLPDSAVADALASLVEKSIVLREDHDTAVRYRMLDTIRSFGREKLRVLGREAEFRREHRDYYLRLAERSEHEWFGPRQVEITTLIRLEHANLRAALDFSVTSPGETTAGLRLAGTLWFYWVGGGMLREGRYWLDRALDSDADPGPDRAKALWVDGHVATLQGDVAWAVKLLEDCRDYAVSSGSEVALAYATHRLGCNALVGDDVEHAMTLFDDARARYQRLGENNSNVMLAGIELAVGAVFLGDLNRAAALCAEARAVGAATGERWANAYAIYVQALVALSRGDPVGATEYGRQSLRITRSFHDLLGSVLVIEVLAWAAAALRRWADAATMLGAADRIWQSVGYPMFGSRYFGAPHQDCVERARQALGERAFEAAMRRGGQLDFDEAVEHALAEDTRRPAEAGAATATRTALTKRERTVAELVAEGLSNKDIAARLLITPRTVESHVAHIMGKLGCASRTQIAVWIAEEGAGTSR